MRALRALLPFLIAAVAAPSAMRAAPSVQEADSVETLVARAATYVKRYQEELTSVVADEIYTQNIRAQVPADKGMAPRRRLRSEVFFMFVPGHDWMAIRDVIEIDRREVGDRPDLKVALRTLPARQVADTFKAYNSRFNLGRVPRNFNEPILSLLVLDDRHRSRFEFDRRRAERMDGETRVTLGFRERRAPTLIVNQKFQPAYSVGEITIEPVSGRVTRAMLAVTIDEVATITLTTTYGPEPKLGIWVPVRFGEHYRDGTPPSSTPPPRSRRGDTNAPVAATATPYYEEIVCEARYTNFRQFIVKTSIR